MPSRSSPSTATFDSTSDEVYVTGDTAFTRDFSDLISTYTPLVFTFVSGLSFLLLMVAFRSIVAPLKAIPTNLLSVAATYGRPVAVFQKGDGADLLGLQTVSASRALLGNRNWRLRHTLH